MSLRASREAATARIALPCGGCIGCRAARARDWAVRCSLEASEHDVSCVVTLTYAAAPPSLRKDHLRDYFKRLRSRVSPRRVRHFACGEYGTRGGRPHYHALLFGLSPDNRSVVKAWPFGHVDVDVMSARAIKYVSGYIVKKFSRAKSETCERVDPDTGEVYVEQGEFRFMSKHPGIGGKARRFVDSWRSNAVLDGNAVPVPRFLHQAWLDAASPEDLALLRRENDAKFSVLDLSVDRLVAGEAIALSRESLDCQRRVFG